jgi:hypothetical protein
MRTIRSRHLARISAVLVARKHTPACGSFQACGKLGGK